MSQETCLFIVKRHFLRGLRGGSERVSSSSITLKINASYSVSYNNMSDGSAEEVEYRFFVFTEIIKLEGDDTYDN